MVEELTFYSDQRSVRITDKRVVLGNRTYALANITSVSTDAAPPSYRGPLVAIVLGIFVLIDGFAKNYAFAWICGTLVTVIGVSWWRGLKPIWRLRIASASGESFPLESPDQQYITGIAQAINEAIIHRP